MAETDIKAAAQAGAGPAVASNVVLAPKDAEPVAVAGGRAGTSNWSCRWSGAVTIKRSERKRRRGSEGWRAEWVIIRELLVCDEVTAVHARAAYPEIPVGVASKGHWLRKGDY